MTCPVQQAVSDAAARWCDAAFPARVFARERIAQRTGYCIRAVDYALDRLFGAITADALRQTVAREIGDAKVRPVGRVAVISSRTTIGVAIVPAIFAICAGCEVLVKDREDHLVRAFFETLAEGLGVTFRADVWEGPERDLSSFDAVVAFGTGETLRAIQARLGPHARFIPYGPACSAGYVAREALESEEAAASVARGAARDLVLYEGEGCMSLHALFVEVGGSVTPDAFARVMACALEEASLEFPPRAAAGDLAKRTNARDLTLFRGTLLAANDSVQYVLERGDPQRPPPFLPRVLPLHEVSGPDEMHAYVRRHRLPLEACAVASKRDDVTAAAIAAGAHRLPRFGEMQSPPLDYAHGGRPRIAEFLRFENAS